MIMFRLFLACALLLAPLHQAVAASGTITTKDAGGVTRTFVVTTDGTGNFVSQTVICDATAAASCASVGVYGTGPGAVPALNVNAYVTNAASPGSQAAAASQSVTASTEDVARIGIITETAPATDTASSGLNGRQQRIAQRLTSMIALLPTALGANGGLKIEGVASGTVVPTSLPASELHLGEIGGNQIRIDVAQTVTASSAYAAGNAIGGKMTIAGAARVSGSLGAAGTGGIIQQVVMNSKSVQTGQVDVFLFNSDPSSSTCTDKTNFVLATADFDKVIGVASIPGTAANNSGWFSGGTGSVGQANNLAMAFDLSSATSIFGCAVARGTPTYAATSDISLKLQILRN